MCSFNCFFLSEFSVTDIAPEWFFAGVNELVLCPVALIRKHIVAYLTMISLARHTAHPTHMHALNVIQSELTIETEFRLRVKQVINRVSK